MRVVPRFGRRVLTQADAVRVADLGAAGTAACPVFAGGVIAAGKGAALRIRAGEHVVHVRRVATAVEHRAFFREDGLLGELAVVVQFIDVLGNQLALGVVPRTFADAIARVDGFVAAAGGGAQVGVPGAAARAGGGGQRLAQLVGTGEATQVGAFARSGAADKKAHLRRAAGLVSLCRFCTISGIGAGRDAHGQQYGCDHCACAQVHGYSSRCVCGCCRSIVSAVLLSWQACTFFPAMRWKRPTGADLQPDSFFRRGGETTRKTAARRQTPARQQAR